MGLSMPDTLLEPTSDGYAQLLVTNPSGFTQTVEQNALLGEATTVEVVWPDDQEAFILATPVGNDLDVAAGHTCSQVGDSHDGSQKKELLEKLGEPTRHGKEAIAGISCMKHSASRRGNEARPALWKWRSTLETPRQGHSHLGECPIQSSKKLLAN